jgi:hypothetical protein
MSTMNGHARDEAPTAPVMVPLPLPVQRLGGEVSPWPPQRPELKTTARTQERTEAVLAPEAAPAAPRTYPWPLLVIAAPAAVAIWSGWVGLGGMCGFGPIHPLPGIADSFTINTAITLPVGVEAYGAYALAVWLGAKGISAKTRRWARVSAVGALALGCLGQVAFHLLSAARWVQAPWPVVTAVSCLPVVSLALAAALAHMIRGDVRSDAGGDPDGGETPSGITAESAAEVSPEPPVQVTPNPVSSQVPSQPEPPAPAVSQVKPQRKTQVKSARISDADLKGEIRASLAAGTAPSVSAVAKTLGRGRDRVRPLLEEVRAEAQP